MSTCNATGTRRDPRAHRRGPLAPLQCTTTKRPPHKTMSGTCERTEVIKSRPRTVTTRGRSPHATQRRDPRPGSSHRRQSRTERRPPHRHHPVRLPRGGNSLGGLRRRPHARLLQVSHSRAVKGTAGRESPPPGKLATPQGGHRPRGTRGLQLLPQSEEPRRKPSLQQGHHHER